MPEQKAAIEAAAPLLSKFVSRKLLVAIVGIVASGLLAVGVPESIAQIAIPSITAIVVAYAGTQGWVDKTQLSAAAVYAESEAKVREVAEAAKAKPEA